MSSVTTFNLLQGFIGAPVRHSVRLDGTPAETPAVTAVCVLTRNLGWCVLADHPDNPGVSVTNGALCYAQAVCRALGCDIGDLAWFEIDSDGHVDELHLLGATAGFAPLIEAGAAPRTLEALAKRAARLPGAFPAAAAGLLEECIGRFTRRAR